MGEAGKQQTERERQRSANRRASAGLPQSLAAINQTLKIDRIVAGACLCLVCRLRADLHTFPALLASAMSLAMLRTSGVRVMTRQAISRPTMQRTTVAAAAVLPMQARCTLAPPSPAAAGPVWTRRCFSAAAASPAAPAAAAPSSASSSAPSSAAAAVPDAEPVNPEDYARSHGFTDDDDEGLGTAGGETPYRESDLDPARTALCERILSAALPLAAESGEWSLPVLRRAASSLGLSPAAVGMLGSNPSAELVWFAMRRAGEEMESKYSAALAANPEFAKAPTSQRLHRALQMRLQSLSPYLSSWPSALAVVSCPSTLSRTVRLQADQIDRLWHLVGDESTDGSWYVKRGLLGGVALSTEMHWITDRSREQQDTLRFLERQLDCARNLAGVPDSVGRATTVLANLGARLFANTRK